MPHLERTRTRLVLSLLALAACGDDAAPAPGDDGAATAPSQDAGTENEDLDASAAGQDGAADDGARPEPSDAQPADDADGSALDAAPAADADAAVTPDPTLCSQGSDCLSGHCALDDGICCDIPCTGTCRSCSRDKTGYPDGICAPIRRGSDPDVECAASPASSCGVAGTGCNGSVTEPGCALHASNVTCAPASCADGVGTPARMCTGTGSCAPAAPSTACGAYACDGSTAACRTACSSALHCASSYVCAAAACVPAAGRGTVVWTTSWTSAIQGGFYEVQGIASDSRGNATISARGSFTGLGATGGVLLTRVSASGVQGFSTPFFRGVVSSVQPGLDDATVLALSTNSLGNCCTTTLTSYDTTGSSLWSRSFAPNDQSANTQLRFITTDGLGSTITRVTHAATLVDRPDYGGGPTSATALLLKYNAAGQFVWQREWPDTRPLLAASDGKLASVRPASEAESVGCPAGAGSGLYVAVLDAQATQCSLGRDAGGVLGEGALAAAPDGDLVLVATVSGNVDFGGGPIAAVGTTDLLVAKLGTNGALRWARRYSGAGFAGTADVSVAANGRIVVGGQFSGTLVLGATSMTAGTSGASFLAQLGPSGDLLGLHQFVGPFAFAADPSGDVLLVSASGTLDLGDGPLIAGSTVMVAAKVKL